MYHTTRRRETEYYAMPVRYGLRRTPIQGDSGRAQGIFDAQKHNAIRDQCCVVLRIWNHSTI